MWNFGTAARATVDVAAAAAAPAVAVVEIDERGSSFAASGRRLSVTN